MPCCLYALLGHDFCQAVCWAASLVAFLAALLAAFLVAFLIVFWNGQPCLSFGLFFWLPFLAAGLVTFIHGP